MKYGSNFQKINKFLALKAIDKLSLNLNLNSLQVSHFLENSSDALTIAYNRTSA